MCLNKKVTSKFFIVFFITCFLCQLAHAQKTNKKPISIQKNGTLRLVQIPIRKKISIKYRTDTGIFELKFKPISYQFPYLYIKNSTDTLVLDVRKIEQLNCTSNNYSLNILAMVWPCSVASGTLLYKAYDVTHLRYFNIGLGLLPLPIAYLFAKNAFRKYNTKTEWSFY